MQEGPYAAFVWAAAILVVAVLFVRQRRFRRKIGPAAAGTVYDWLNEDKKKAVEIVVEERAGARDPEDRDGNLPELEDPRGSGPRQREGGAA